MTLEQIVDTFRVGERIPADVKLPEPSLISPSMQYMGPVGGLEGPLDYEPQITEAEIEAVARGGDGSEASRAR